MSMKKYMHFNRLFYLLIFILAVVLVIILLASVINYEVMFRDKGQTENEEYTKDYYSKPENARTMPFFITIITIITIIIIIMLIREYL